MTKSRGIRIRKHSGTCALAACHRPYYAKGYCRLHWERADRNGDPETMHVLRGSSPAERLAHYSQADGECVVFTGYRDKDGYGKLSIDGEDNSAHRVAYELEHGAIPDGLVVRHKCDNPPCIKVAHLEVGTHADNGNDKAVRRRAPYGMENPGAKLSEHDVLAIREAIRNGIKQRDLAAQYGVGQSTISRIKRETHWRYLLEGTDS